MAPHRRGGARAFNELAASAEAFLYGRKVYEVMIPYWPDAVEDATKPAHERDYGRIWVDKPKVVFSTTLTETRWNTRVVPSGARDEVLRLKNESKGYLLVTGALSSYRIREAGLVDEYALFVHPSALGAGVPFFRRRLDLKLVGVRRFDTGVLALRYSTQLRD